MWKSDAFETNKTHARKCQKAHGSRKVLFYQDVVSCL